MKILKICFGILAVNISFMAAAAPIIIDDRATFENTGSIVEFQDFESFNPDDFTSLEDNFVDGSVTYTSNGTNLIVGANTFINPLSNTLSNDVFGTSVSADVSGEFTMLGIDMALNGSADSVVNFTLNTNFGAYIFDLLLPQVQDKQLFQGFVLGSGEYFTGFSFSEVDFVHIDNVTLGNVVEASSPSSMGVLLLGILTLGALSRKARKVYRAN